MMRLFVSIWLTLLAIAVLTGIVHSQDVPQIPIEANFERSDTQWHIVTRQGDSPLIRASFYQGTNSWSPSGWAGVFAYGKSSSDSVTLVTGSVVFVTNAVTTNSFTTNVYMNFQTTTNTFPHPVDRWYSMILLTKDSYRISIPDGLLTIERSPVYP